jgi:hypothetical protein
MKPDRLPALPIFCAARLERGDAPCPKCGHVAKPTPEFLAWIRAAE